MQEPKLMSRIAEKKDSLVGLDVGSRGKFRALQDSCSESSYIRFYSEIGLILMTILK